MNFYTPPVFPENILQHVIFNYSKNCSGKRKFDTFSIIFQKMVYDSNNVAPSAFSQVATPIVAQAPVKPTNVPISVLPREKLEKINGLNFKR